MQRRVATVTLHMAEQYPGECIRLSAYEIVAGRRAGPVKCIKWLLICGKKHLRIWLPTDVRAAEQL